MRENLLKWKKSLQCQKFLLKNLFVCVEPVSMVTLTKWFKNKQRLKRCSTGWVAISFHLIFLWSCWSVCDERSLIRMQRGLLQAAVSRATNANTARAFLVKEKTWLQTEIHEALRVHTRESFCKHYKRMLDAGARWKRRGRAPHEGWIDERHGAWVTCCEKCWKIFGELFTDFICNLVDLLQKLRLIKMKLHLKWWRIQPSTSKAPLSFIILTKALFKHEFFTIPSHHIRCT